MKPKARTFRVGQKEYKEAYYKSEDGLAAWVLNAQCPIARRFVLTSRGGYCIQGTHFCSKNCGQSKLPRECHIQTHPDHLDAWYVYVQGRLEDWYAGLQKDTHL